MNSNTCIALLLALSTALPACRTSDASASEPDLARAIRATLELPVSEPPFGDVHANWKERLDQPYVFLEVHGSYTQTAASLQGVFKALADAGVEPCGAPFALFYDDPGHKPVNELRSRACVPVTGEVAVAAPYAYDVLPSATVAYAFAGGPYGDAPRAYPGVYAFMRKMNWVECGPIRESYLVSPGSTSNWSQLVCEIQIPAGPAH